MLTLGDNFSYQGAKPLDARLKYDTTAAMKAVADATMYEGCLAYCAATDKTYQWKSTNTVDTDLGKWREFAQIEEMPAADMAQVVNPLPVPVGAQNPTGTIISFMGTIAPQGYLACNGQTLNIASYPRLANFFEVQFGSKNYFGGDGTTTFAVPDLSGEFLRGTGTNSHSDGGSGSAVGVHQGASTVLAIGTAANASGFVFNAKATETYPINQDKSIGSGVKASQLKPTGTGESTWDSTSSYGYYVRPTNTSVLYCIKD